MNKPGFYGLLASGLISAGIGGYFTSQLAPPRSMYSQKTDLSVRVSEEVLQECLVIGKDVYFMSEKELSRLSRMVYDNPNFTNKTEVLEKINDVRMVERKISYRKLIMVPSGIVALACLLLGSLGASRIAGSSSKKKI